MKTINPDVAVSERTLNNKMKKLEEALHELNMAHTSWLSKAELSDVDLAADKYSLTWLETEWGKFSDLQDQVEYKLSVYSAQSIPPVQTNSQKLQISSKQMETLQLDIQTKVGNLVARTADDITSGSHKIYSEMLSNVKDSLNVQFTELFQTILSLDSENLVTRLGEYEQFRQTHQAHIVTIELQLAEKIPSTSSCLPKVNTKGIEMEKSKAPTFNGRTIDYPEFKRGWKKVAGVVWDDANQVEQIKLKVDTETRRIISRCKTMFEVWSALDTEYAQEQEVINAVDEELKALRSIDCSTAEYIVKLRNHLPNLEDALREVDGLEHLHSPERVNRMVEKFDERTVHEWEYFRSKTTGTTYKRFFDFLLDRYDAARSSIARLKSRSCNLDMQNCLQQHVINHASTGENECRRCNNWIARDEVYTCPECGRGTLRDHKINHCLEHCGAYMSMSVNERSKCVEKMKWCPIHLLGSHQLNDCSMKNDPRFVCAIEGCLKHHHKSLHGSTTPFMANVNSTGFDDFKHEDNVLLLVQSIETITGTVNCFYDNGSSCCLITNSAAQRLNLVGQPMNLTISTVNGKRTLDSCAYHVTLVDKEQGRHTITAFGVDNISSHLSHVNISAVKSEFSQDIQDKWNLLDRPLGEIDLLVGQNACGLHPTDLVIKGNLKIMSSLFGTGYMLVGAHPYIKSQNVGWNEAISSIWLASIQKSQCSASHVVNRVGVSVKPSHEFFEGDIMGIHPPR